jgi:secreted trypsin-like serine protease
MSRSVVLVLLLAVTSTATAGQRLAPSTPQQSDDANNAVVGGSTVPPGQWPDAVAVLGTNGTCTGTLIAPDVVLTAGHCAGIKPTQVIANTTDYSQDGGVRVQVARTEAYPNWQQEYDAAVLVLASPIEGVAPRKIGTSCTFDDFARTTSVRLVGFGATDMMGQTANTQLKQAMTAVTDPECTGGNGCKQEIAPGGEFVAGGTGTADSCFGDSGGPVYLDTPFGAVVIGAVSRGVAGAETPCGGGGIYVRTDKLIDWIEDTTGRTIEADGCDGNEYSSEDVVDDAADEVGCSATRGASLGALPLVLLALLRKRRH